MGLDAKGPIPPQTKLHFLVVSWRTHHCCRRDTAVSSGKQSFMSTRSNSQSQELLVFRCEIMFKLLSCVIAYNPLSFMKKGKQRI